jgi:hypothetical protein
MIDYQGESMRDIMNKILKDSNAKKVFSTYIKLVPAMDMEQKNVFEISSPLQSIQIVPLHRRKNRRCTTKNLILVFTFIDMADSSDSNHILEVFMDMENKIICLNNRPVNDEYEQFAIELCRSYNREMKRI